MTCKFFSTIQKPDKYGTGICDRAHWYDEDYPSTEGDGPAYFGLLATASDDSGLYACIMVGPSFGCIHHAPNQ